MGFISMMVWLPEGLNYRQSLFDLLDQKYSNITVTGQWLAVGACLFNNLLSPFICKPWIVVMIVVTIRIFWCVMLKLEFKWSNKDCTITQQSKHFGLLKLFYESMLCIYLCHTNLHEQASIATGSQLLTRMWPGLVKPRNALRHCVNNVLQVPSYVYAR